MTRRLLIVATAAAILTACITRAAGAQCATPPNEECDTAIEFTFAALPLSFPGQLGCDNDMVDRPYFDVFFKYACTVTGEYVVDMCGTTGDSYMRIYVDGCGFGPASSWVEDDDACPGSPNTLDPLITLTLQAGTDYWFELGAWREASAFPPNENDPYVFNIAFIPPCDADCADPADDSVDVSDLLAVLAQWGGPGGCDIVVNNRVDIEDLLELLATWGDCG